MGAKADHTKKHKRVIMLEGVEHTAVIAAVTKEQGRTCRVYNHTRWRRRLCVQQ